MIPPQRYLLDTNVVSALRVRGRNPEVASWVSSVATADLFISALTIVEIERGVVSKERTDPRQGVVLRSWFEDRVLPVFSGRILPFDLSVARVLASYPVPERAPFGDALIAATAQVAQMPVVTRNTRHFQPLGVACINPWVKVEDGT